MKKILCFGMSNNMGGIESFIINYYRKLDKSIVKHDFVICSEHICFEEEIERNGNGIWRIPSRKTNPIKFYFTWIKLLKQHPEYNIIHFHLNSCSSIELLIISKLMGRKVIVHSHSVYQGKSKITRFLDSVNKRVLPFCGDIFLACSKPAGDFMFRKNKYQIVPNGIDVKKFAYNPQIREQYRKEMKLSDKLVIGNIGRLRYEKNQIFLLEIMQEILKQRQDIILLIVGDGELRKMLEQKTHEMGLEKNVRFLGMQKEINILLQVMDLFLFPSLFEGLGIALIEAQAAGLKCFSSKNKVPKEVNVTNTIEFISLEEDNKEWAKNILSKWNDLNLNRYQMNQKVIDSGYSAENTVKQLEKIYLSLQ